MIAERYKSSTHHDEKRHQHRSAVRTVPRSRAFRIDLDGERERAIEVAGHAFAAVLLDPVLKAKSRRRRPGQWRRPIRASALSSDSATTARPSATVIEVKKRYGSPTELGRLAIEQAFEPQHFGRAQDRHDVDHHGYSQSRLKNILAGATEFFPFEHMRIWSSTASNQAA
jgi:hypothetical protein